MTAKAHRPSRHPLKGRSIRLADRLLAEATSAWEQIEPHRISDSHADEAAREAGGDFEHRLIVRSRSLAWAPVLNEALRQVRGAISLIIIVGVVLAALAGAATARAVLGDVRDEPVNFFWALSAIVGVQTLALVVWLGLFIASRWKGARMLSIASLGGLVIRLGQFLASRLGKGPHHAAAIAAISAVHMRGRIGRWSLSAISHGLWLSFNAGCLVLIILLLSARQYTFGWETTILSERQYVPLTRAVAAVPRWLGFNTPTIEQVAASQWTGAAMAGPQRQAIMEARHAWSSLLAGCLVAYGFGPRLLLLGLSLGQARQARARYRIDTDRPEFLRLQRTLMPETRSLGVVDADEGADESAGAHDHQNTLPQRPVGEPAILGLELSFSPGQFAWPPPVHGVRWVDLGFIDNRNDQRRVINSLARLSTEPRTVVIVCALTTTPDRGIRAFFHELSGVVERPLTLVLTGGQALRQRADAAQLEHRLEDWRALAMSAGFQPQRIIEVDLDHLTQASAAKLASLMDSGSPPGSPSDRHIEQAFALIVAGAGHWIQRGGAPSAAEQAELHRQIARLYGNQRASWRDVLAVPASLSGDVAGQLRIGADRVMNLLPGRLRLNPRWLAAGAAAGALGCVAAATLIAPAAIASLPLWSAAGAALAALLKKINGSHSATNGDENSFSNPDAVRSSALFAILLELQGRDEAAITRLLDRIISDDDGHEELGDAESARRWLERLRHRLDLALSRETAP